MIDRKPNKNGRAYRIEKGSRNPVLITGHSAIFVMDALGQEGSFLEVEENGTFALPLDPEAARKPYRFLGVRQGAMGPELVIEGHEAGERKKYLLPAP